MASHNRPDHLRDDPSEFMVLNNVPVAFHDDFDENDEAQEKRREERRRRKKENRREDLLSVDEGDPDVLLEKPAKQKRKKRKNPRPELWYDDSLEEPLDETLEQDGRKGRRKDNDDQWDS